MTVSAWIYSTAFPADDAAIVSKKNADGFQLDTTVDTGPRTIGFKLTNSFGGDMMRYGATALQPNTWYYVTGVYNAAAQTLDVYLNGALDNGVLKGTITSSQQNSSNVNVMIGRRAQTGYEFIGRIDDVRIADHALTPDQNPDGHDDSAGRGAGAGYHSAHDHADSSDCRSGLGHRHGHGHGVGQHRCRGRPVPARRRPARRRGHHHSLSRELGYDHGDERQPHAAGSCPRCGRQLHRFGPAHAHGFQHDGAGAGYRILWALQPGMHSMRPPVRPPSMCRGTALQER